MNRTTTADGLPSNVISFRAPNVIDFPKPESPNITQRVQKIIQRVTIRTLIGLGLAQQEITRTPVPSVTFRSPPHRRGTTNGAA